MKNQVYYLIMAVLSTWYLFFDYRAGIPLIMVLIVNEVLRDINK